MKGHNHGITSETKPYGECPGCDVYWSNAKDPNPRADDRSDIARIIMLSCSTKMKESTALHYADNLIKAGYGRAPVPEEPSVSHRGVLQDLLEGEQREIRIRDWALEYLTDDEKQQRYEGFKRRAETTQQAIERHQQKRDLACLRAAALTTAISMFPEGEK